MKNINHSILEFFKIIERMIDSGATCSEILEKINTQPYEIKSLFGTEYLSTLRSGGDIPYSIGKLQSLKFLEISCNRLRKLPKSIGSLQNLKYLQADENRLTKLPNSIGSMKKLKTLSFESNRLVKLPESIKRMTNLQALFIEGNPLKDPPKWLERFKIKRSNS